MDGVAREPIGRESTHLVLLALLRELVDEFRGKPVTHEVGRSVRNVTPTVRAFAVWNWRRSTNQDPIAGEPRQRIARHTEGFGAQQAVTSVGKAIQSLVGSADTFAVNTLALLMVLLLLALTLGVFVVDVAVVNPRCYRTIAAWASAHGYACW